MYLGLTASETNYTKYSTNYRTIFYLHISDFHVSVLFSDDMLINFTVTQFVEIIQISCLLTIDFSWFRLDNVTCDLVWHQLSISLHTAVISALILTKITIVYSIQVFIVTFLSYLYQSLNTQIIAI